MSRMQDLSIVSRCFRAGHGAAIDPAFADFTIETGPSGTVAVLGYRRANEEALFLEAYLDEPIERLMARALGRRIKRGQLIEIGNLASVNPLAMMSLWANVANSLGGSDEYVVATLTAQLRSMFRRIGIPIHELAPAIPDGRIADIPSWGRYYAADPVICCGRIASGQDALARFTAQRRRSAAA